MLCRQDLEEIRYSEELIETIILSHTCNRDQDQSIRRDLIEQWPGEG